MRVLVTGAAGFAGQYLLRELASHGHTPIAADRVEADQAPAGIPYHQVDLTDAAGLHAAVQAAQPDAVIHLGGIAFVPLGWSDPGQVMQINLVGTLNLLEAVRGVNPAARVLVVTSSEVYGRAERPEPVREADALTASNLYGVSKLAADQAARLYAQHHQMHILTARPQNHIGPGQSRLFVVSAFAEQLLALQQNSNDGVLRVGNLDAQRDFTDVRDVVRAYRLLIENGAAGEAYNIASGHLVAVRELLDALCEEAGIHPRIEVDPERYRPTDAPPLLCIEKIKQQVGWTPEIPLRQTLGEIYREMAAP
jgi:GDP-4-dehydro-6-deoxy-D-mannose reductase